MTTALLSYDEWMDELTDLLELNFGTPVEELRTVNFQDRYLDGFSPSDTATELLRMMQSQCPDC